jgi:hypothetical protein
MDNLERSLDVGRVNVPVLRRRKFQHASGSGAALAQRLQPVTNAARAIRVLVAVFLLVAINLDDAHASPIGVKLLSDDQAR